MVYLKKKKKTIVLSLSRLLIGIAMKYNSLNERERSLTSAAGIQLLVECSTYKLKHAKRKQCEHKTVTVRKRCSVGYCRVPVPGGD